jgi:hypothetical protein
MIPVRIKKGQGLNLPGLIERVREIVPEAVILLGAVYVGPEGGAAFALTLQAPKIDRDKVPHVLDVIKAGVTGGANVPQA